MSRIGIDYDKMEEDALRDRDKEITVDAVNDFENMSLKGFQKRFFEQRTEAKKWHR